jgi:hypothetical protein
MNEDRDIPRSRVSRLAVSYASDRYLAGQTRLLLSLEKLSIPCHAFYEQKSGQSGKFTPHSEIPYYFKAEIMAKTARYAETILWCDASIFATGASLDPIFQHIERHGYLLPWGGFKNSEWCNDRSLRAFGFTRDQAESQRHIMGALYGVRTDHPLGKLILEEHLRHRDLFCGQHDNLTKSESSDPRCHGHRHDQSVLSLIAYEHDLEISDCPASWIHYGEDPSAILNILSARDPRC